MFLAFSARSWLSVFCLSLRLCGSARESSFRFPPFFASSRALVWPLPLRPDSRQLLDNLAVRAVGPDPERLAAAHQHAAGQSARAVGAEIETIPPYQLEAVAAAPGVSGLDADGLVQQLPPLAPAEVAGDLARPVQRLGGGVPPQAQRGQQQQRRNDRRRRIVHRAFRSST